MASFPGSRVEGFRGCGLRVYGVERIWGFGLRVANPGIQNSPSQAFRA